MKERDADLVWAISRAVLYEGYLLWPYRPSALKNRRRWTFGSVLPRAWCAAHASGDRWWLRCECLLETRGAPEVHAELRFLHAVRRRVATDDSIRANAGGRRRLDGDEATERTLVTSVPAPNARRVLRIAIRAGSSEATCEEAVEAGGPIERSWQALSVVMTVQCRRVAPGLLRLRVSVANNTPLAAGDRDVALRQSLLSAHLVLRARSGRFVSLTDPPDALREAAGACRNAGVWPVLVGAEDDRHTLLASPIILPDHPRIAPESGGDLFDSTEIEPLLVLGVRAMGDEEREEVAASDPRARALLERVRELDPEALRRLSGAVRSFGPAERP